MKAVFWLIAIITCLCVAIGIPILLHYACGMSVGMAIFTTVCIYVLFVCVEILWIYFEDMYYSKRKNGLDKGKKM